MRAPPAKPRRRAEHACLEPSPPSDRVDCRRFAIGPQEKDAAVRQLDMGNLELHALASDNRKVLAPIELERLAGAESHDAGVVSG